MMDADVSPRPALLVCDDCRSSPPAVVRPAKRTRLCRGCFTRQIEADVLKTIRTHRLFEKGQRVAIAVSGGKDSTVLADILISLNRNHDLQLDLHLLAIDEGIHGYRDDSLEVVKQNQTTYGIPLLILSYEDLYEGWSMDRVVGSIGKTNNCTFCGVFRRRALDLGASRLGAQMLCTGHNADDCAETVLLNLQRGDLARLGRCAGVVTGRQEGSSTPRCKPLMFIYEKEIVLYAHFKKLPFFSTECIYSPNAYRGHARAFIKDIEAHNPQAVLDILTSVIHLAPAAPTDSDEGQLSSIEKESHREAAPRLTTCKRCGAISSSDVCKACLLVEGLHAGKGLQACRVGAKTVDR